MQIIERWSSIERKCPYFTSNNYLRQCGEGHTLCT